MACTQVLANEQGATTAAFWRRAEAWFAARGVVAERVLTDNPFSYQGPLLNEALAEHRISTSTAGPTGPGATAR